MTLRVCIQPSFDANAVGGVSRVVLAQHQYLPHYDIEIVDDAQDAQVFIGHAGEWISREDIPRVAYTHGLYWTEPVYNWPRWAQIRNAEIGRALVEADMIVTPAQWVADIIRRDLWAPVNVVPNGVDPGLIDAPVISYPSSYVLWDKARIDEVCEVESLIALASLAPGRQFVMHVVPPRRSLPQNLIATGVVPYDRAIQVVQNAGVYLATTREVHGVSVLEALASGVPVLGYAWGGAREQLTASDQPSPFQRNEGILVPPGNIGLLKEGLEALSDPAVWKQASEAAKERSRAFNWLHIMEGFAGDLHQLWSGWPGHRPANAPEISVIIPCYNLGKYLDGCLASVYAQHNAPPFEVIVVDDASTDPLTQERLRHWEHAEGGPRVIRHASNRYLAEALNTGIAAARGKWIINLDSDNELPKDALRNLARAAARHPELDCVYGLMEIIRDDGSLDPRWPKGIATYPPRTYSYPDQLAHLNQVHSSAMFRRRMWERAGGYRQYVGAPESFGGSAVRLNSDAEFWTRAAALGFRFGRVIEEPTLRYRVVAGSMSRTVPDWDWTEPSPRLSVMTLGAPGGQLRTHEPIQISVIVEGSSPEGIVESLWPQTFDRWECLVAGWRGKAFLPPYAKVVTSGEEAEQRVQGRWILRLDSDSVSRLEPEALEAFYAAHEKSPPGLYDVEDPSLKGKVVMACGSCGGGMRVTRRPGPPASARKPAGRNSGGTNEAASMPTARQPVQTVPAMAGISGRMTFVEFTGSGFRTRYMHRMDPTTRRRFQYIFGNEPDHRRVLVYVEDVPEIIQNISYREVPRDDLTEAQAAQLDAINAAAETRASKPVPTSPRVVITAAGGRRTFAGNEDPGDAHAEQELLTVGTEWQS